MISSERIIARLMDEHDLDRTLNRMARQIVEHVDPEEEGPAGLALIGLQTRGVPLARRLQKKIRDFDGIVLDVGILDITMYRDDVRRRAAQAVVRATHIPFNIDDRHIVLVDDVLYTGRTSRAALDALIDIGRPASVRLLIIIDRGLRELPINADFVGREVPTTPGESVRVCVSEIDGEDGVWLVRSDVANSTPTSE